MEIKEILLDHRVVRFREEGKGPAVVFVHGFGEDGTVWQLQAEAMKEYRVIIPDLPGSGSELIDDMSMEGLAGWVYRLLMQLAIKKCVLIGHSMGGYITLAFAEKHPSLLSGFGLCPSTAFADTEEKKSARRKGIDFIRRQGAFAFLKTSIPNLYSPESREKNPSLPETHLERVKNFPAEALIAYYEAMIQRPDRTRVLETSTVPVLFIFGKEDSAVPLQDGLRQCHLPQQAHVFLLEHSGHMVMLEEPGQTNEALRSFLKVAQG